MTEFSDVSFLRQIRADGEQEMLYTTICPYCAKGVGLTAGNIDGFVNCTWVRYGCGRRFFYSAQTGTSHTMEELSSARRKKAS